ncbi:MAG: hypothetical protein F6K18_19300 [Okeania sp. SIO2C2]|uniref:hypothetical protein n=1 Tax=Okeania sp. SIO2C2 TaxID=2607787 RepID=UPI0013BBE891|nr:hypothetical protein [Okeania sp. SIO2C2]NEP88809.1 hypothetical protein [Okeania sp. SIO2C2]
MSRLEKRRGLGVWGVWEPTPNIKSGSIGIKSFEVGGPSQEDRVRREKIYEDLVMVKIKNVFIPN